MKSVLSLAMAAALVTMTACSSDDDDDTPVAGGDTAGDTAGTTDTGGTDADGTDAGATDGDGTDAGATDGDGTDAGATDGDGTDAGATDGDGTDAGATDGGGTDGGDGGVAVGGTFQIEFTNMTLNQPMTLPVVAMHDPSVNLFRVGETVSDPIRDIAETGADAELLAFATDPANAAVIGEAGVAGDPMLAPAFGAGTPNSASVMISLSAEAGEVLSAVSMIICTNDGISGFDSISLPADNEPLTLTAVPYDAGTRVNQNDSYSFFPPPCRSDGAGGLVDVVEAPEEAERLPLGPHAGQMQTVNTPDGRNWDFATGDDVIQITITRN